MRLIRNNEVNKKHLTCWAAVVVQLFEFELKNSSELCCARRAILRRPICLDRGSDTHELAADWNPRRDFSSAERMLSSASRDFRKRSPKSESVSGLRTLYDAARVSIWKARRTSQQKYLRKPFRILSLFCYVT